MSSTRKMCWKVLRTRKMCWKVGITLGLALWISSLQGLSSACAQDAGAPTPTTRVEDGHTGETVDIPTAWLEPTNPSADAEPEPPEVDLTSPASTTARPTHWVSPALRRCQRYHRRRFCDGPLRVPVPSAQELERATRLDLGGIGVARQLLLEGPRPEWVAAVAGSPRASLLFPVDGGRIWRGLEPARRRHPGHLGTDIGAPEHSTVRATNDGLVVYAGNELRGYGNLLMIVHADSSVTFYAHLSAAWVPAGARVSRGQIVGEVGETGLARGTHLHFEWRVGGHPRDPAHRFADVERDASAAHSPTGGGTTPLTAAATDREPSFTDPTGAGTNLHVIAAPSDDLP